MISKSVDAASLLMLRDGPLGPQVYMVRRHPASRFLANALVFAGGRLDEGDAAPDMLACCAGVAPEEAARWMGVDAGRASLACGLYVTAVRECFEECGILLAERPADPPRAAELAIMRGMLLDGGVSFVDLCRHHELHIPLGKLRFLDRWITPESEPRRFDARFFVCRAPESQEAAIDAREMTFGAWLTAGEALEEHRSRRQTLAPPTLTILERLRGLATVDEVLAAAPDRPLAPTMPRLLPGTAELVLLLPGDHRYDEPGSRSGPEHYVTLEEGCWRRVCSQAG